MAASLYFRTQLKDLLETKLSQNNVSTERLSVSQRNKQFQNGEFHVPNGCFSLLTGESEAFLDDIRDSLIKESQSWSAKICDIKKGTHVCLEIFIDRKSLFSSCIEAVLMEGNDYGRAKTGHSQSVLLDLVCGSYRREDMALIFDDLRALALAQHIQLLLESQGHQVSVAVSKHHMETFQSLMSMLNMDCSSTAHSDLLEEDIHQFMQKAVYHPCCETNKHIKEHVGANSKPLNHNSESPIDARQRTEISSELKLVPCDLSSLEGSSYEFNFSQFVEEKGYQRDKYNFDKNLNLVEVITKGKPTDFSKHVITIEKTVQESDASVCLHIVQQNQAFQLQKVHILLEALSQTQKTSQRHFVYGPIALRKDDSSSEGFNVDSYLKLRYEQMRDAAVMKYGAAVKGEGWETTIKSVTSAGIKFELLSSTARSHLKLDLNKGDASSISDIRNGSFVMYNCARLATLFLHFQQAVEKGLYPPLPDIKDIDFSSLREESEWSLVFNYVYMYPETVRQAVEDFMPDDGIISKIHTHKVSVFLCGLSRHFSSYYSRTHVLGENRPHLLPTMYARLYLLKAVHQVMINGLALLGITALTQL